MVGLPWARAFQILKKDSSTKYVAAQTGSGYVATNWNASTDCSGINEVSNLPAGSTSQFYSSSSASFSGLVGFNNYADDGCTGTPTSGVAFANSGKCVAQQVATCANGALTLKYYDAENCTGNSSTITFGATCAFGIQAFCSGSLTIPGSYQGSAIYSAPNCGSLDGLTWSLMGYCFPSGTTSKKVRLIQVVIK